MYTFLLIIHVVVCIFLVAVILLQAGKGGGMSETLGGSITQSILGTRSTAFMTKLTAVCASIFLLTSLALTFFSAQKRVSLFRHYRAPSTIPSSVPSLPVAPETPRAKTEVTPTSTAVGESQSKAPPSQSEKEPVTP